jgi:penicillin amidase
VAGAGTALRAALRVGAPAIVLGAGLYAGFRPIGELPPLGGLLDPLHGVWAVAAEPDLPAGTERLPSLGESVRVVFDDRAVPHIFAGNVADAVRALGYLHARFRLFQMEVQTRATTGRLTEWFGPVALGADQRQRELGLARSAELEIASLDPDGRLSMLLLAYAEGVNARIDQLSARDLPLEYRLLNRQPARWEPVNTLYLLRRMGYTLAYLPDERTRERVAALVGPDAAAALVPINSPIQEPIVPSPRAPRVDVSRLPPPAPPQAMTGDGRTTAPPDDRGGVAGVSGSWLLPGGGLSGQGRGRAASNNWVVAPWRTADGHALLAGDPHLDLSLPSIWFEAHLVVADTLDVYGVSFPGAPLVVIGFNRDVAWSFTNTGADVLDFYQEELDQSERPSRYRMDGAWHPLDSRIEEYRGTDGRVLATDTIYFTHRGPVVREGGRALSLRWTVLEGDGAVEALWDASRARSVIGWLSAMERFRVPIQNGVVADRTGDIAVLAPGWYPERPGGRDGMTIRDGTRSANDWQGELVPSRYPYARNPAQGYLASANQQPIDPAVDPVYLGANWPSPWRALRINQLLRADSSLTPDDLRAFQTDPGSPHADWFVPAFLQAVARETTVGRASVETQAAAALLGEWDRRYTPDNERAVLFEMAMDALEAALWDELVPGGGEGRRTYTPSGAVLAGLLRDSLSGWWDDRRTPNLRETRDAVLAASLEAGYRRARETHGDPAAGGWRWGDVRFQNIHHLLRLPALSRLRIPVQGGPDLINPSNGGGTFGASWRMVVQLGRDIRAWGVYPGGQSGNPMSRWYDDRIDTWSAGALDSLPFPRAPGDLVGERRAASLILEGGPR